MKNSPHVVILGGYGNFGKRIAENLAQLSSIQITIVGRNVDKARALCQQLRQTGATATLRYAVLDIKADDFQHQLGELKPTLVIHTGGPFQGQDYRVPKACIAVKSHYIDLADDRRYVCDIKQLDVSARKNNVLLVSGASSVPGLSSAVIDAYQSRFAQLTNIEFAIAPGNQAERGLATVSGILSYLGKPFPVWINGAWQPRYGWLSPTTWTFDKVIGKRHLATINIPDLELFPMRYPTLQTVVFYAGLELSFLHYTMVAMAWLAKQKWVNSWQPLAKSIFLAGEWFKRYGSDIGGMQIRLSGTDNDGKQKQIQWVLRAEDNIGPYIPTLSALIVAKKLLSNDPAKHLTQRGATACVGLFDLAEFDVEALPLGITHHWQEKTNE